MKVLVTGSNGLLGQKLTDKMLAEPGKWQLVATSKGPNRHPAKEGYLYEDMDVTNAAQVYDIVSRHRPEVLIHTAAMTNVDACEKDREGCYALNVEAVEAIVAACSKFSVRLIHLSTDFIFDGEDGPYTEEDIPNPLSYYGQSKLDAERAIERSHCHWAILRTVIVYGVVKDMTRSNIILWAKQALEKGQQINVVDDQWRMPTLAEDLADCCLLAAEKKAHGIYNASGKDMLSILELVQAVAAFWKLDQSLIRPVSSALLNQPAARPKRTGFILDKTMNDLGYNPHSFTEGLAIVDGQLKN